MISASKGICSICYEPITDNDKSSHITKEKVDHLFHCSCASKWQEKNGNYTCPICRESWQAWDPEEGLELAIAQIRRESANQPERK